MSALENELRTAEDAALAAGRVLKARFGAAPTGVRVKGGRMTELVSDADMAADSVIRSLLLAAHPEDGIISEEVAPEPGSSGRHWVIDPLDGTTNYLCGIPFWAVSIALKLDDEVLVGAIYDPMRDELFSSAATASSRGVALKASTRDAVEEGVVSCLLSAQGMSETRVLALLKRFRAKRELGATALELAWVAAGRMDGCIYRRDGTPWDWLAGERLILDAGGVVLLEPFDGADFSFAGSAGMAKAMFHS